MLLLGPYFTVAFAALFVIGALYGIIMFVITTMKMGRALSRRYNTRKVLVALVFLLIYVLNGYGAIRQISPTNPWNDCPNGYTHDVDPNEPGSGTSQYILNHLNKCS